MEFCRATNEFTMQLSHPLHPTIERPSSAKKIFAEQFNLRRLYHFAMEGYAKLASIMGSHPEVAILRRFGALNVQNLLYLQAELVALEDDLRAIAAEDNASRDPNRAIYSRDWHTLSNSKNHGETAGKQWQIVLSIREKLKEYSRSAYCRCTQ